MNKVRFNDKELSFVAHYSTPDKEGLLDKKGAVYGQGTVLGLSSVNMHVSYDIT